MSWRTLENEMSDVLSAEYAEPIRHVPMKRADVNARAIPDPSRPEQTAKGMFEWQGWEIDLGMGHSKGRMPGAGATSSRKPCVYIDRRDFTNEVRADDRLVVIDLGVVLEVVDAIPDGQGRIELRCNQIGRSTQ